MVTRETFNVLQCGLGLGLVLFAFLAMSSIEETTLSDMHQRNPSISTQAGYYSQTIIYGLFIVSNILAPPIVAFLSCRWSLVIGSAGYTLFMSQFLYLSNFTLYGGSALEGLAAGLMWTAAGYYMALNSTDKTVGRNSSLLWLLSSASNIAGGIYLLAIFSTTDSEDIDESLTTVLYGTFCGVAFIGNIVFALCRTNPKEGELREKKRANYVAELVGIFRLAPTRNMLLLAFPYAYTGLHTSFYSAVYPTSLSFTTNFPMSSKMVLGMNNLSVGLGQVFGCVLFIVIDHHVVRLGRFTGLVFGTALNLVALTLIGLDIPVDAPMAETTASSVIPPNAVVACVAGLLLGIVDSSFHTQLYAITSSLYEENCAQAMALFMFYHALLSTCSMFYGGLLLLPIQLSILGLLSVVSTATFAVAELMNRRRPAETTNRIQPAEELTDCEGIEAKA